MVVAKILPPVMLPVAVINPPVDRLAPVMLPLADTTVPNKLEPVMVDVADIRPPVNRLPPEMLAAVTLPVTDTTAPRKLVPVMVPPADIKPPVSKLEPVMLPVVLKLVPVAAPILGVVNAALALTIILPVPSNAVVIPSVLALITVPFKLIPAAVLAVYVCELLNRVN